MTRYVVLDIETTGLDTSNDAIVEVAAVRVESGAITGEFEELIAARKESHPDALGAHKLSHDFLSSNGKRPEDVFSAFVGFVGEDALVAHNGVNFDFLMLVSEFRRYSVPMAGNRLLDSLPLSKAYLERPEKGYGLEELCRVYEIPNPQAHRAMSDVRATTEIMRLILAKNADFDTLWKTSYGFDFQSLAALPPGFSLLDTAIRRKADLKVLYAGKDKPPGERWIRPTALYVDKAGNRGITAWCLGDNAKKHFRLDGIVKFLELRRSK